MEMPRSHRVAGALIGSAVGDALGAPFEFGPPGQFSARFPTEVRGVHTDAAPGEFTDDTQLALLLGPSLPDGPHPGLRLGRPRGARGRPGEADVFLRVRAWARAAPRVRDRQTRAGLG